MIHKYDINPPFSTLGAAWALGGGLCVAAGLVAGLLAVAGHGHEAGLELAGAGAAGFAALVSLVPIAMGARQGASGVSLGFVIGGVARAALTLGGVLAIALPRGLDVEQIGLWAAVWYVLVLGMEAGLTIQYLKRCGREPAGASEGW